MAAPMSAHNNQGMSTNMASTTQDSIFNLQSAMGSLSSVVPNPPNLHQHNCQIRSQYGVAADSLPDIDTVPNNIRSKIIEGKDVNLVLLLVPSMDSTQTKYIDCISGEVKIKMDARLQLH